MIAPVTLENAVVRLEPLRRDHAAELVKAAADGELWNLWYTSVPGRDSVDAYIEKALAGHAAGHELPFVIRLRESGTIVGSKLGASQEGILRHHRVLPDGSLRDSVLFSIAATEWPPIRETLQTRIERQVTS